MLKRPSRTYCYLWPTTLTWQRLKCKPQEPSCDYQCRASSGVASGGNLSKWRPWPFLCQLEEILSFPQPRLVLSQLKSLVKADAILRSGLNWRSFCGRLGWCGGLQGLAPRPHPPWTATGILHKRLPISSDGRPTRFLGSYLRPRRLYQSQRDIVEVYRTRSHNRLQIGSVEGGLFRLVRFRNWVVVMEVGWARGCWVVVQVCQVPNGALVNLRVRSTATACDANSVIS